MFSRMNGRYCALLAQDRGQIPGARCAPVYTSSIDENFDRTCCNEERRESLRSGDRYGGAGSLSLTAKITHSLNAHTERDFATSAWRGKQGRTDDHSPFFKDLECLEIRYRLSNAPHRYTQIHTRISSDSLDILNVN